jgi:oligogalacturonide lyase
MRTWKSERKVTTDPYAKTEIVTLTDYRGHSNHFYFTNNGFWDEGRRLLFSSERENVRNLFSVHIDSGEITQLTTAEGTEDVLEVQKAVVSPRRRVAYVPRGSSIVSVDLLTGNTEVLYSGSRDFRPDSRSFRPGILSMSADETRIVSTFCEDTLSEPDPRFVAGYNGFLRYFSSGPLSRILAVDLDTGTPSILHEDQRWLAHVNCSPTLPDILTFCHEGPWQHVAQRMWGLNTVEGTVWPIRSQKEGEYVGHEYWMADGINIGYHGHTYPAGGSGGSVVPVFGTVSYDNSRFDEAPFPHDSNHYHSRDAEIIVGDGPARIGRDFLMVWKRSGGSYHGPRILAHHGSSRHIQAVHVHPRVAPDGKSILYTSDISGYGQVCLATLPDWDLLPTEESVLRGDVPR